MLKKRKALKEYNNEKETYDRKQFDSYELVTKALFEMEKWIKHIGRIQRAIRVVPSEPVAEYLRGEEIIAKNELLIAMQLFDRLRNEFNQIVETIPDEFRRFPEKGKGVYWKSNSNDELIAIAGILKV